MLGTYEAYPKETSGSPVKPPVWGMRCCDTLWHGVVTSPSLQILHHALLWAHILPARHITTWCCHCNGIYVYNVNIIWTHKLDKAWRKMKKCNEISWDNCTSVDCRPLVCKIGMPKVHILICMSKLRNAYFTPKWSILRWKNLAMQCGGGLKAGI